MTHCFVKEPERIHKDYSFEMGSEHSFKTAFHFSCHLTFLKILNVKIEKKDPIFA